MQNHGQTANSMVGRSENVHTQMHANSPYFGSPCREINHHLTINGCYKPSNKWVVYDIALITSTPLQFDMPSLNINIPARFRRPPILEKPLLRHNAVSILSCFQNFNGGNHGTVLCSKTCRIFSNLFCASEFRQRFSRFFQGISATKFPVQEKILQRSGPSVCRCERKSYNVAAQMCASAREDLTT